MAPSTTARLATMSPNDPCAMLHLLRSRRLAPLILRWPLVEERTHALVVVVRGAQPRVRLALELQRGVQRRVGAAVAHHLERPERQRWPLAQLRRQRVDRRVEPVVGHRLRDEAPGFRARGRDALACHHEQLGARHPDEPHRALGAAAAGDHAQPHLGKRELRPKRGDAEVAGHRQLEAGPHRIPVDGRDDGLAAALGGGERIAPRLEVGRGQRQELGDVAAGAEGLAAGAADDDRPHRVVLLQIAEDAGELVAHRDGHRVHLGLPVDPESGHVTGALHAQELAHVVISEYWPSRSRRRRILPEAVLGISRTRTTQRGRLKTASSALARQWASSASNVRPAVDGTTNATTRWPQRSSASPITATSRTSGWRASTSSTSIGWMFSPPLMIMSSTRPLTYSSPSASR